VEAIHFDEVPAEHFDLIVNGTTTGLNHEAPAIDPETFNDCLLAYDLVYAADPTPFMRLASTGGAKQVVDGLGMLIEQAAESYQFWRGVRPDTAAVYKQLRQLLKDAPAEHAALR
jgi:shikimate dehydrogenase